ncbi:MAG: glycosyltransferase family 2 protein [Candidatus Omnitrophota bacterium]
MAYGCDIILLSYESPGLLEKCVRSVLDHTRVRSRLIIVDNASRDPEVARYIGGISGNETVAVEKIFSEENEGFAGGMNLGLRLSGAPFACLLNNDCVVTEGWLEEMIAVARSRDDIGLVNPQSNTFGSKSPGEKGKYSELGHAIGFACLVKKEVIDRIGYLDEAYQGVCYEDTDFSIRAQKAGYISVVAEGAYVFHLEQASRRNLKEKEEIYRRNREIFEKRWGKLLRVLHLNSRYSDKEDIFYDYEILKGIARERAIVDMWIGAGGRFSPDEIYQRTVKHVDIGVHTIPGSFVKISMLLKVLTKKKKYDAAIVDSRDVASLLRFLQPVHKTEVLFREGRTRVVSGNGRAFDMEKPGEISEYLRKRM